MKDFKFDEVEHVYTLDGKRMYGTTTILKCLAKPALLPWAVKLTTEWIRGNCKKHDFGHPYYEVTDADLDEAKKQHTKKKEDAADWGSIVHRAIEVWIKSKETPAKLEVKDKEVEVLPEHKVAIDNFIKWAMDNKVEFIDSERCIYSEEWFTAGTVDFVCKMDGKLVIGDLKTSSGIWEEYWLQISAYAKMMMEMGLYEKFDEMTIVNCKKDGTIKVESRKNIAECIKTFEAAIIIYKYQNK